MLLPWAWSMEHGMEMEMEFQSEITRCHRLKERLSNSHATFTYMRTLEALGSNRVIVADN